MLDMPVDEMLDAHIHLFNLKGTPRPMQPLGKLFGWNERVLRFMATKLMPDDTVNFFGPGTPLLADYMPVDYRADVESSGVGRYVHVQAAWTDKRPLDPVGETVWLESLDDGPAAIIGYADLSLGADVAPVLAAHNAASTRMRGIRHMLAWHHDKTVMNHAVRPRLAHDPRFREGFDRLTEHGLSFDAWCYSAQIDEVSALAQHNPDVPMVLCHMGTPIGIGGEFGGIGVSEQERARIAGEWRDGISGLALNKHVNCKLSGLLMPVLGFGYEHSKKSPSVAELVGRLSPMIEHCIDAFGPERCMVASNFPVDKVAVTYETMTKAMLEMTHRYGLEAQQAMFAGTAETFYRI